MSDQVKLPSVGLGFGLGVLAVVCVWAAIPYFHRASFNSEIRVVFDHVTVGQGNKEAALTLVSHTRGLPVGSSNANGVQRWFLSAPHRLLQDHWVLVVCVADGRVKGKRIGIGDNANVSPAGAPPPQGDC